MGHKHCKPGEYEHMSPDGVPYCSKDKKKHWPYPDNWTRDHIPQGASTFELKVWLIVAWIVLLLLIMGVSIAYGVRLRKLNKDIRAVQRRVEDQERPVPAYAAGVLDEGKDGSKEEVYLEKAKDLV